MSSDDGRRPNKRWERLAKKVGSPPDPFRYRGILYEIPDAGSAPPPPPMRDRLLALASSLLIALAVAGLLAVLALVAYGAPAPAYRGPDLRTRLTRAGWSVTWARPDYGCYCDDCLSRATPHAGTARLFPSGLWACHRGGLQYLGAWSLEGRTLTFTEECEEEPWRSGRSYVVELADDGAGFGGEFDGGGRLALRP